MAMRLRFTLLLLTVQFFAAQVLVGQKQFGEASYILTINSPKIILPTDFNDDGLTDIVASQGSNESLLFYTNNGGTPPTFEQGIMVSSYSDIRALQAADLNADGKNDLVYIKSSNKLGCLINTGMITMSPIDLAIEDDLLVREFAVGDFDNNGYQDVVATVGAGNLWQAVTFLNDGLGSFSDGVESEPNIDNIEFRTNWDIDADGDLDIVASDPYHNMVYLENNGSGLFSDPKPIPGFELDYALATPTDFDQDGDLDYLLAVTNAADNTVDFMLYTNNNDDTFTNMTFLPNQTVDFVYDHFLGAADVDCDGFNDIVIQFGTPLSKSFGVMRNNGQNAFDGIELFESNVLNGFVPTGSTKLSDIDGDNYLDVLTVFSDDIYWFENMPAPIAAFEMDDCRNTLANTSMAYLPNSTFLWDFGNGTTSTEEAPAWPYTEQDAGSYAVSLTLCLNDSCSTEEQTINVEHHFDYNIPNTGIVGEEILFEDNSLGFTNWTWIIGNDNISTDQSTTYTFDSPGTYQVELYQTDGAVLDCTNYYIESIVIAPPALIACREDVGLTIGPNPSNDFCLIKTASDCDWRYTLTNLEGKVAQRGQFQGRELLLDLAYFASGIYVFKLSNDKGGTEVVKLLIE